MFYFKEIYFRVFYCVIGFFILFFINYYSTNSFFLLLSLKNECNQNLNFEMTFIINSPYQFLKMTVYFCFFLTFFAILPFVCWTILNFLNTGFTKAEKKLIYKTTFRILGSFYIFNYVSFTYIFPYFWSFYEVLDVSTYQILTFNVEHESNLFDYFLALHDFLRISNFIFLANLLILKIVFTFHLTYRVKIAYFCIFAFFNFLIFGFSTLNTLSLLSLYFTLFVAKKMLFLQSILKHVINRRKFNSVYL